MSHWNYLLQNIQEMPTFVKVPQQKTNQISYQYKTSQGIYSSFWDESAQIVSTVFFELPICSIFKIQKQLVIKLTTYYST